MKNIQFITIASFLATLVLVSCNEKQGNDLESKKMLLTEKKAEFNNLKLEIEKLTEEIVELSLEREKPKRLVTTTDIEVKTFEEFVEVQSTVQSGDMVMANAESGGRLVKLNVDEGDYISKGSIIGVLDTEAVQRQLDELNTSLELAQTTYERQERLWKQNIGSEMAFLQAKNAVDRLQKSKSSIQLQLSKGSIHAPLSGYVDKKLVNSGEVIAPGQPLVQILNLNTVKIIGELSESYLGTIKKGDNIKIEFPAIGETAMGKVSRIGRSIDPNNRTFQIEVKLANKKAQYKPNLLATMYVNNLTIENAIVVPTHLVQHEIDGKSFVYIVHEENMETSAKKLYVETGPSNNDEMVITKGLSGNEKLIDEGARNTTDGELIQTSKAN